MFVVEELTFLFFLSLLLLFLGFEVRKALEAIESGGASGFRGCSGF